MKRVARHYVSSYRTYTPFSFSTFSKRGCLSSNKRCSRGKKRDTRQSQQQKQIVRTPTSTKTSTAQAFKSQNCHRAQIRTVHPPRTEKLLFFVNYSVISQAVTRRTTSTREGEGEKKLDGNRQQEEDWKETVMSLDCHIHNFMPPGPPPELTAMSYLQLKHQPYDQHVVKLPPTLRNRVPHRLHQQVYCSLNSIFNKQPCIMSLNCHSYDSMYLCLTIPISNSHDPDSTLREWPSCH